MKIKPEVIGFIGLAAIVGMAIGKGMRNADKNEDTDTGGTDDGTTSDYCGYDQSKLAGHTLIMPENGDYNNYTVWKPGGGYCLINGVYAPSGCQSKKACKSGCGGSWYSGGRTMARNKILR